MRNRTSQIIIAIAAIAVIVGVIIAVASPSGHSRSSDKSHAHVARKGTGAVLVTADYLGITRAQVRAETRTGHTLAEIADARSGKSAAGLIDALVSARAPAVEAAAAQGKLSKTATAARLAALRAVAIARVNGERAAGGTAIPAAARYLGLSVNQLREKQRAGHSLAEIADASSGKSSAGLTAVLVSSQRSAIAAAEATGLLTSVQAQARRATLPARVARAVDRKPGQARGAKG
jgi:hypothetical protein